MKKIIISCLKVIVLTGITGTLFCVPLLEAAPPKSETINLSVGSTSSTSGAYIWAVAVTRAINKYDPGISCTLVESGATYDNLRRIKEGIFHWSAADGWAGGLEMYKGLETFKGNAWEPIRWFILRDLTASRTYVRADSGIKTWSELAGKTVAGGTPGSAAAVRVIRSNEVLGTKAKFFMGTFESATADLQMGRIAAVHKSGPVDTFDAALLSAHMTTPLTVIGFSDEEAAKLNTTYPQFLITKTPAGAIKILPKLGSVWEIYSITGAHASSRLPEEIGYRIIKAVHKNWNEIGKAFPACAPYDPIADYIKIVPSGMELHLHAGVVRYAEEIGIKVPDFLIPPEYKRK